LAINKRNNNKPYTTKKYAEHYNDIWIFPEGVKDSVDIEIQILEELLKDKETWLDTACGTGYHLQNVEADVKRAGVDRSRQMLDAAYRDDITFYKRDIVKGLDDIGKYDLVSNLGYGYVHQKSLLDVLKFFESISNAVAIGGDLLIGHDNPGFWLPRDNSESNTFGNVTLKAVIWDYYEDDTDTLYSDCISPHRNLIIETVGSAYEDIIDIELPTDWKKDALLFKTKKDS